MSRSRGSSESGISIPNVTSLTESNSGNEGSLKRRFTSTLDRIFRNKLSPNSPQSLDASFEIEHIDTEEDKEEDICTDDSGESDSEALTSWNGMEGHTNLQFMFDNQCHLDNLQPEVVLTFPSNKKVGCLSDASDVIYIGDGRSLVVDMIGNRVLHFNKRGVSSISYSTDDMVEPWAVAVNTEEVIHVTSKKTKCVTRFSKNGEIKAPLKNVNFMTPSGIAIDKNDRIIVSDLTSNLLTIHEPDGTFISTVGSSMSPIQQLDRPRYVTVAPNNDIIVCDSGNHSLKVFDSDGNFVQKIGALGKGEGQLKCPYGVCTDAFGNIIVADHYNDRVSFFSKTGQFIRHLVTSLDGLMHPQGVCLTSNLRLLVTHGGLKANEVLVYDIRNNKIDKTSSETLVFV